ncbi:MAG TPA: alanine racemase, partial [Motilibacteraceae bacterium]|nr:alanine racemase [Motilibacteraceae bacterium]
AGLTAPVLSWLAAPGEGWDAALAADVDVSAGAPWLVEEVAAAARRVGHPARLHLEADTGLSRGGATAGDWPALLAAARAGEEAGVLRIVGVWSHFACSDEPQHPANAAQLAAFRDRLADVERAGLRPQVRHLANSGGALFVPGAAFDLVRAGIAVYGVSPAADVDPRQLGLLPAMTLRGRLAHVKRVTAGNGVSYGHSEILERDTTLGIVPLGYGDGLPRQASGRAEVLVRGRRRRVVGRVCMDQVVVDLGDDVPGVDVAVGDEVLLFGPGEAGEPQAEDWARAAGTIGYEIVTRIGGRVPRTYAGALVDAGTVPARAGGVPQGAGA